MRRLPCLIGLQVGVVLILAGAPAGAFAQDQPNAASGGGALGGTSGPNTANGGTAHAPPPRRSAPAPRQAPAPAPVRTPAAAPAPVVANAPATAPVHRAPARSGAAPAHRARHTATKAAHKPAHKAAHKPAPKQVAAVAAATLAPVDDERSVAVAHASTPPAPVAGGSEVTPFVIAAALALMLVVSGRALRHELRGG